MVILIIIVGCIAGFLAWQLFEQHKEDKIQKQNQKYMKIRHSLMIDINRIITENENYIVNAKNSIKYITSHGCLVKLQLSFHNGKSVTLLCSETYFLVVNDNEVDYKQYPRDTMKSYIAYYCDTLIDYKRNDIVSANVAFLEDFRQRA